EELIRKRRSQITAASIKVFKKLGFHKATVRDVASTAKVSIGMIYQYFGDKGDLLYLALLEILTAYKEKIPPATKDLASPLERFIAAVQAYCRVHGQSSDATILAYRESASLSKAHREMIKQLELETNELIAVCIRDCIKEGYFREINETLFTYQVVMFSHTWALKSWVLKNIMTIDDYVENGLEFFLSAAITPHGLKHLQSFGDKYSKIIPRNPETNA